MIIKSTILYNDVIISMFTTSVNNLCHVYDRGTLVMFFSNITYVQIHNLRL